MAITAHRRLAAAGVRRCQAVAAASNRAVVPWLTRLGYRHEGRHPGYGRGGETFCTYGKVMQGVLP
jgi:hypothetical protein